jgi:MFS family permease
MNLQNYKRTRFTCFFTFPALTPAFVLPPILFATFRQMYGISYTLLGTLVLVNFCTQLGVDLVFAFFSRHFHIHKTIRTMPLLSALGLVIYALVPWLMPQYAYPGLLVGTFIFSVASGLDEALLSPTLAALPSDNPQRDMSILHSMYGYGLAVIAVISTLFLQLFGRENWMYLTLFWAIPPIIDCVLFHISPLPEITIHQESAGSSSKKRNIGLALCAAVIFLGSAAENTMTNWISVYMERALQIPKAVGDTLGLVTFALLLAFARSLYAKYGKRIFPVLLAGMLGALGCYLLAGMSSSLIVAMVACMLTGICTSMLWPGTLILMEEEFPNPGVAAYALMAAGGDFGASVAPQGLGIVADTVAASEHAVTLGEKIGLSPEQIGIKAGMLTAAIFPLLGIGMLLLLKRFLAKKA